ncbi:hypothetical protein OH77DRAFT_356639 [Trametes cingulata]|nr:hypothetical protein OH77DRAFT_356639 [Trametes cingulata]
MMTGRPSEHPRCHALSSTGVASFCYCRVSQEPATDSLRTRLGDLDSCMRATHAWSCIRSTRQLRRAPVTIQCGVPCFGVCKSPAYSVCASESSLRPRSTRTLASALHYTLVHGRMMTGRPSEHPRCHVIALLVGPVDGERAHHNPRLSAPPV